MEKYFITDMEIEKVRHLININIPLDKEQPKHLILTGKNGSGKTSVLLALSNFLATTVGRFPIELLHPLDSNSLVLNATFKRCYIREHKSRYPDLLKFIA